MTENLLAEVVTHTQPVTFTATAERIVVGPDMTLDALLIHCVAILSATEVMASREELRAYLKLLYPEAAKRMDANQALHLRDWSGADIAVMLCVFGQNPFRVMRPDATLDVESDTYKLMHLQRVEDQYSMPSSREAPPTQALPAPDLLNDPTFESTPEEFLYTLVRMLVDNTYSPATLQSIAMPQPPQWHREMTVHTKLTNVSSFHTANYERFAAPFSDPMAVVRLVRALLGTLYARMYAGDADTLASLPDPIQWALYNTDQLEFGVLCRTRESTQAADSEQLAALMGALYVDLELYPPSVEPHSATWDGGRVRLKLSALLGARFPRLPSSSPGSSLQCILRYGARPQPDDWFSHDQIAGSDAYKFNVPANRFNSRQIEQASSPPLVQ